MTKERVKEDLQTVSDCMGSTYCSGTEDDEAFRRVSDYIRSLELDLGLMTISRDHQSELLKSCEQALIDRDERVADLSKKLDQATGLLTITARAELLAEWAK